MANADRIRAALADANPWFPAADDRFAWPLPASAEAAVFAEMRRQASRLRFATGVRDWNAWAKRMVTLHASVADAPAMLRVWRELATADFSSSRFEKFDASELIFPGPVMFANSRLGLDVPLRPHARAAARTFYAGFIATRFADTADFSETVFLRDALFENAEFFGPVRFAGATFNGDAEFRQAKFHAPADFGDARFAKTLWLSGATFAADARFAGASFAGDVSMAAVYGGSSDFSAARFSDTTSFETAQFRGPVRFDQAHFARKAWFRRARFEGAASFNGTRFAGGMDFSEVEVTASGHIRDQIASLASRVG